MGYQEIQLYPIGLKFKSRPHDSNRNIWLSLRQATAMSRLHTAGGTLPRPRWCRLIAALAPGATGLPALICHAKFQHVSTCSPTVRVVYYGMKWWHDRRDRHDLPSIGTWSAITIKPSEASWPVSYKSDLDKTLKSAGPLWFRSWPS